YLLTTQYFYHFQRLSLLEFEYRTRNVEPQNTRLPCIAIGVKVINVTIPSLYGILHEQRKGIAGRSK
ncbi:MAG: hypothetical protein KKC23_02460, partial [Proteobacteria bacterium]|nr:hypothetical protein [Pseudomonadota bacterium]